MYEVYIVGYRDARIKVSINITYLTTQCAAVTAQFSVSNAAPHLCRKVAKIINHTIQYNTIQYNKIKYNTIQYNTIQYNTIQYNTILYNTIQYNVIQ